MAVLGDTIINGVLRVNGKISSSSGGDFNIDKVYPVGAIYMSVVNTNPGTLFGGTWEQLKDRFLLGAGSTYTAGNTGGSATKTISKANLPNYTLYNANHSHTFTGTAESHTHSFTKGGFVVAFGTSVNDTSSYGTGYGMNTVFGSGWYPNNNKYPSTNNSTSITPKGTNSGTNITVNSGGSGTALDVMNPYLVVYMWKRTA